MCLFDHQRFIFSEGNNLRFAHHGLLIQNKLFHLILHEVMLLNFEIQKKRQKQPDISLFVSYLTFVET